MLPSKIESGSTQKFRYIYIYIFFGYYEYADTELQGSTKKKKKQERFPFFFFFLQRVQRLRKATRERESLYSKNDLGFKRRKKKKDVLPKSKTCALLIQTYILARRHKTYTAVCLEDLHVFFFVVVVVVVVGRRRRRILKKGGHKSTNEK